jgi:hypothetical protein
MAKSTILHVGNDICHRIPIMRAASFAVFQIEVSIPAIREALAGGDTFSAITFHADFSAPPRDVICAARTLSVAPLVLFENAWTDYDRSAFDFAIPNLTHPSRWLRKLHDAIEASRAQCERSLRLRRECETLFSAFPASTGGDTFGIPPNLPL